MFTIDSRAEEESNSRHVRSRIVITSERAIAVYEARVITRCRRATWDRTPTKETSNGEANSTLEAVSWHASCTEAIKSTAGFL
jgi:hypothetical protein